MVENKEDLQYIAGFFDGEGSISLFCRGAVKYKTHQLQVQITNTDGDVLKWIDEVLGKEGHFHLKHRTGNQRSCWDLQWTSLRAEKVLETLIPFLKTKRKQAELALEFRRTFPPHWSRHPVSQELYDQREGLRQRLKLVRKAV